MVLTEDKYHKDFLQNIQPDNKILSNFYIFQKFNNV